MMLFVCSSIHGNKKHHFRPSPSLQPAMMMMVAIAVVAMTEGNCKRTLYPMPRKMKLIITNCVRRERNAVESRIDCTDKYTPSCSSLKLSQDVFVPTLNPLHLRKLIFFLHFLLNFSFNFLLHLSFFHLLT